jgi:hypothetical protein
VLPATEFQPHVVEFENQTDVIERRLGHAANCTTFLKVPHTAGEAARALRTLKDAGVNLLAFSGCPEGRRAQLDFIPVDAAAFKSVAKANKWKVIGPKRGFLIQGDDRVGAIADIVGALADAKINVIAIDAVCADSRYGSLCWVAPRDVKKAAQVLGSQ